MLVCSVAALCGVGLLALYSQQRNSALEHARDVSRALATAVDAQLQRSMAALQVLATSPLLERGDLDAFYAQALQVLSTQKPQWAAVHLTSPEGLRLVDTSYELGAPMPPPSPLVDAGLVEDVEVGHDRADQRPVRRLDDDERDAWQLALPALPHLGGLLGVLADVHRDHVGRDRARDVDRAGC